ncbi:MAG: hypothetical protein BTN85_1018 [Candidatus Methanohalarchaeum thermophilum]|uniref:Uncharacterized protein n=1 Tax=Methanohalarchaeum thermophilum TaxID=1903181 RepID=A0A1Q6DVY2_METT1|nr:MAG: hypothetical protein BTN85_1018 [Candidatus Methanohalarchaeum thermophilum]
MDNLGSSAYCPKDGSEELKDVIGSTIGLIKVFVAHLKVRLG